MNESQTLERETVVSQMRKSLEAAIVAWDVLVESSNNATPINAEYQAVEISIDKVIETISKSIGLPISKRRRDLIGEALTNVLNQYGINGCALWSFAHRLDHVLWDHPDQLPPA